MTVAESLNAALAGVHPAAAAALSDLGRRIYFPRDIPSQSAEARGCALNATIGEVTDGEGNPLALPAIVAHLPDLDAREVFLYSSQGGEPRLRQAWAERTLARAAVPISLPLVTCGITHGLSVAADLFADPDTDVLLPWPGWGNYKLIFGVRRGARLLPYTQFKDGVWSTDGLEAALAQVRGKAVVVLNFPSNPTGYTPTQAEADALVALLKAAPGPLVVICDDAYQDMLWEPGLAARSPFYALTEADPARILAVKLDGATKELFFFGARVGFITFGVGPAAAEALVEKAKGILRSTVSSMPGPSQALVRAALADPGLQAQRARTLERVAARYRLLKSEMIGAEIPFFPFNSGFFALIPVKGEPEALRQRLLRQSVGVVALTDWPAIRLAYGSARTEDLPALVRAIRGALAER